MQSEKKIKEVCKIFEDKPKLPQKRFRYVNGRVVELKMISSQRHDIEADNSDVDVTDTREQSESESSSEPETLSKPECISRECLTFINQVSRCLTYLMYFKEELDKDFTGEGETAKVLTNVFRDVQILKSSYGHIGETIDTLKSRNGGFFLYELLLDPIVSNLLKMYKPFLSQYAVNAKWMGDFCKDNQICEEACNRTRKNKDIANNVNIDNCLYTVFNSLFSLELMFSRYRNCFAESTVNYQKSGEAKNLISNLLSVINTNQDQTNFLLTQKELNLLTGRSRDSKINTRFVYKGIATKFARRDDKSLSRQLVLFTDCLYVTLLPGNIVGTSSVRQELSINSISVTEIHEDEVPNVHNLKWGLSISAREAVQDFFFDNEQTMKTWKDKLLCVIKEETSTSTEAMNKRSSVFIKVKNNLISLGLEAPRWQKDSAAGYCNGFHCNQKFSAAIRRHHCRADGLLYCDACCNFKVKLEFERSAESKVCELCYNIIFAYAKNPKLLEETKDKLDIVMERRTHVGKKTGWLFVRFYNKDKNFFMSSMKYFCELDLQDAFLKLYEKHEDKCHSTGIILLGMEIKTMKEGSHYYKTLSPKEFMIQHTDKNEMYLMKAPSQDECLKWVECLKERISTSLYN